VGVLVRLATFDTSADWVGFGLLWAFGLALIIVRYREARLHERAGARLTRAEVRYAVLVLAIAALFAGPTGATGIVFTLGLIGFIGLTLAVIVRNRRVDRSTAA
jgi:hypothetical protein